MDHDDTITFQLATHYLPRIALRLECLFLTIDDACQATHSVIHHYALKNVIEITQLIGKPELKSRFLKEFMRIEHALNKSQAVISDKLYADLFLQIQRLNDVSGKFGHAIHQDQFLQSVSLSRTSQQNDFELYSPQLLLWLESDTSQRQADLSAWLEQLQTLYETVVIYLSLLRQSAKFDVIQLLNGFYQRSLPANTTCHLILLKMNKKSGIVPKMHLGHHGLSLRMCEKNSMHEIHNTTTQVDLAICQL